MAKKRKKGKFGCFENETNVSSSFEHVLLTFNQFQSYYVRQNKTSAEHNLS